jgi:hypothetical protein
MDPAIANNPLLRRGLVEIKASRSGKRYRVKGLPMAWCSSLMEALRIAHILLRSGRVTSGLRG